MEEVKEANKETAKVDADVSWYVIHTYSGYENKVKANLERRIESLEAQNEVFKVIIPTEEEIEVREGKKKTISKKVFPGYILVQMKVNDRSWDVVRNTPGVTGFVGVGNKPTPLGEEEMKNIMKRMEGETPRVKVGFSRGDSIRIIDGPFIDFVGVVDSISAEAGKVRVLLSFFGRETPVEIDLLQVERL